MYEPRFPAAVTQQHPNTVVRELCRQVNRAERHLCVSILEMNARTAQLTKMLESGLTLDTWHQDCHRHANDITAAMMRREVAYEILAEVFGSEAYARFMDQYPSRIKNDD
jgi:hypothetical protein